MFGYIYKTTNLVNNKIYVGQKKSEVFLEARYLGSGTRLKAAIQKYGESNFLVEQLDQADSASELDQKEIFWIDKLDARNPSIGYNLAEGGNGTHGIPAWNRGLTKETEPRLIQSEAANQKRSESLKRAYKEGRRTSSTGGWKCAPRTPEMREANSQRQRGKRWMILVQDGELKDRRTAMPEQFETLLAQGYIFGRGDVKITNPFRGKTKETDAHLRNASEKAHARVQQTGHQGCFGLKGKDHPRSTYKLALEIADENFYNYWLENGQEATRRHYHISRNTYKYCCDILNIVETPEHLFSIRSKSRK